MMIQSRRFTHLAPADNGLHATVNPCWLNMSSELAGANQTIGGQLELGAAPGPVTPAEDRDSIR
jgi:hypothetical protein